MTNDLEERDYGAGGFTIQKAMIHARRTQRSQGTGPLSILWKGLHVQTADSLVVSKNGVVRVHFLKVSPLIRQGFDLKIPSGGCLLANGEIQEHLRTFYEPELDAMVQYNYVAPGGLLKTWNIYEVRRGARLETEMWTGNAGFWIEQEGPLDRVYHCSHGSAQTPDFESIVYRLSVTSA